jgi:transcriptional regulator with XRE-family HTH domain
VNLIERVRAANRLPPPALGREIRIAARATQQQLADELGVHVVTIARWESGAREPRGEMRARYAALLEALGEVTK